MLVRELRELLGTLPQEDVVVVESDETRESAEEIVFKWPDNMRDQLRPHVALVRAYDGMSVIYLVPGS